MCPFLYNSMSTTVLLSVWLGCNGMSDICFVLDSSGSEGAVNFHKQLEFVNMIINEFAIDEQNTRVCVITFSTRVHKEIHLNSYDDAAALMQNLLRIQYRLVRKMQLDIWSKRVHMVNPLNGTSSIPKSPLYRRWPVVQNCLIAIQKCL